MLKTKILSAVFLTSSVLIFSVLIPIAQDKISAIKENREIYFKNLASSQFQQTTGAIAVDLWQMLDFLEKSGTVKDNNLVITLEKSKKFYLEQANQSVARYYFLGTESVSDDKEPDINRFNEILSRVKQQSPTLDTESKEYLSNFNKKYQSDLDFWKLIERWEYGIAIILQILGVMFGLYVKDDSKDDLLKEVRALRGQVDRIPKK
jgi:hypothetical protein